MESLCPIYQISMHRLIVYYRKQSSGSGLKNVKKPFLKIKEKLGSAEALVHFNPSLPIFLAADASSVDIGAVIFHRYPDDTKKAIAHASKTLTPTEKNYSQIEWEALALIYGVKKFHQYLWGREFTLQTDHKPLTIIFGKNKGIPPTTAGRLQRWALILMGYSYDIEYKSTKYLVMQMDCHVYLLGLTNVLTDRIMAESM